MAKKKNDRRQSLQEEAPPKKSGGELAKALSDGSLIEPLDERVIILGMVKEAEEDAGAILFSPNRSCDAWIEIPPDLIDDWKRVGQAPCDGHSHPMVRLLLKAPSADVNPEAAVFARLLRMERSRISAWLLSGTTHCSFHGHPHCGGGGGPASHWVQGWASNCTDAGDDAAIKADKLCKDDYGSGAYFDFWLQQSMRNGLWEP